MMDKERNYVTTFGRMIIFETVSNNIHCLNNGFYTINGRRIETEMKHIFVCPICDYFECDTKWEDVCEIGMNHIKKHIMRRRIK